jgi:hypothetical protein
MDTLKIIKNIVKKLLFINEFSISNEVVEFLNTFSFNRNIRFKHVYFDKVNDMADNNIYEGNKRCIYERLLIIGSGLNGDLIALDLKNLKVGYVFHDDLWEDKSINPIEIFVSLNCTIGEFYYNSIVIESFPVDGLQAEKYLK